MNDKEFNFREDLERYVFATTKKEQDEAIKILKEHHKGWIISS